MRPLIVLIAAGTIAAIGCSGSDEPDATTAESTTTEITTADTSTPETSTTTVTTSTTTAAATTTAASTSTTSTVTPTTTPTTTSAAPTTTAACPSVGDTAEQREAFPERMSALVGADIRTGAQACFERVVIELQASDLPSDDTFPGWWVRYADGPVTYGQTDDQYVDIRGDEILLITVNSWMFYPEGVGYDGPTDIVPTNVEHIEQLLLIDNWEGQHTWAVGLDELRGFGVDVLADPPRLVIDIQG